MRIASSGGILRFVLPHPKTPVAKERTDDWVPWTVAYFPGRVSRDAFLESVERARNAAWAVQADPDDFKVARVRWRPNHFLGLNDRAHAHHGRIIVAIASRRI